MNVEAESDRDRALAEAERLCSLRFEGFRPQRLASVLQRIARYKPGSEEEFVGVSVLYLLADDLTHTEIEVAVAIVRAAAGLSDG